VGEDGGVGVCVVIGSGVGEEAEFEAADASDAPAGVDHLIDEEGFMGGGWLEVGFVFGS
jgi:hypothetical protein